MKWKSIETNSQIISTRNYLQLDTITVILDKSKKISGSPGKRHDFEMSMHSCRMCCTIIVHCIGVPIIKSCSSSLNPPPEFYPFV